MSDAFTTYLALTKPEVTGSTDTWGGKLNDNLDTIDKRLDGVHTVGLAGGSVTLNDAQAKNPVIECTGTAAADVTITFPTTKRSYVVVVSGTLGAYKVICKTSGQTGGVNIALAGATRIVCNGTNIVAETLQDALDLVRYSDRYKAKGNVSGATAINLLEGLTQSLTITGNTTLSFTNVPSGSTRATGITLFITNGGAYTITWPASTKWAGGSAPSFSSSGLDIVALITLDGSTWHGVLGGLAFA
ncbi:MAG: hypothetical protein AB7P02_17290 [Alphaproteobacteria bacterium]